MADVTFRYLQSAYMCPQKEKGYDARTRPWDILIKSSWKAGKPVGLDFAVTYPLQQQSNSFATVRDAGSWATAYGERHKGAERARSAAEGVIFHPMVVESYGAWSPEAAEVLNDIADEYAIHRGIRKGLARHFLYQALSTNLQMSNACMLVSRNTHTPAEELALPDVPEVNAFDEEFEGDGVLC